ncbi:hypothetical protein [Ralstonia mannitolilytica]|uniref:hypothetical protein n=1 Tax=Ralstonia mannitolilytica TaxID=105219 RepID=UPI001C9750EB|nr:hypothetical protein [Ralstonia mannitolilytica]MBY4717558.1 hypothetical protein [Ralstonia mannitolilytica]
MAKEEYMDEFERDQQERIAGSNSHWDGALADEIGIPTVRKSWKSDDRVVVNDPNAGRQPSALDMVPLSVSVLSNTFLPRWKVELIEEQNKAEKPVSMAKQLSNDIQSSTYDYGDKATKSVKTTI